MIIIERPQLNFFQRLIAAFKSQSIIAWLLVLFMIVAGVIFQDRVKGIILVVLGTFYLLLLASWIFRIARTYIYKIEELEHCVTIYYLFNKMPMQRVISLSQNHFRIFDKSVYSLKQIHFLEDEKTIIKQYAFGPWKEEEIVKLEKELKRMGFKKPFGENL